MKKHSPDTHLAGRTWYLSGAYHHASFLSSLPVVFLHSCTRAQNEHRDTEWKIVFCNVSRPITKTATKLTIIHIPHQ